MKIALMVCAVAALLFSGVASATKCFDGRKVVRVASGYVEGSKGADGGDAVYFTLDNGQVYPLAYSYNLDWPRGQALHRMLMTAMASRFFVAGFDHHGTRCDDIDEIWISEIR